MNRYIIFEKLSARSIQKTHYLIICMVFSMPVVWDVFFRGCHERWFQLHQLNLTRYQRGHLCYLARYTHVYVCYNSTCIVVMDNSIHREIYKHFLLKHRQIWGNGVQEWFCGQAITGIHLSIGVMSLVFRTMFHYYIFLYDSSTVNLSTNLS